VGLLTVPFQTLFPDQICKIIAPAIQRESRSKAQGEATNDAMLAENMTGVCVASRKKWTFLPAASPSVTRRSKAFISYALYQLMSRVGDVENSARSRQIERQKSAIQRKSHLELRPSDQTGGCRTELLETIANLLQYLVGMEACPGS